ncbi:MAG TPA: FAD-dependent monooxygenase [Mycobacterium sp.]|nr:FAD-dependent monooxygenase [Mycobacterium sp.]
MNTTVLIVGAGPTGLTMAIELARRGVDVEIVDASAEMHDDTRALGVQPRTLELFDTIGVADAAVDRGLPVGAFSVFSENKRIIHVNMNGLDTPYPFTLMLPQSQTEALLAARLAEFGVTVKRPVELTALTQDRNGVQATLRHADGRIELTECDWLVGCDGARSRVRTQLGVPFAGTAFEENFAVADLRLDWSMPHDQFLAFLNRGSFVAYFPMPSGAYRTAVGYPKGQAPEGDVSFSEIQRAVEKCSPEGARVTAVNQTARFRINQRKVERHSVGRVFLAGDAAHIHSVVGAQGMNTGIQDAFNLGWKLAGVALNRAPRQLLDTYQDERAPVVNRLVKGTRTFTRLVLLGNPLATAARRNIASRVMSRPGRQHRLARAISEVDVTYRARSRAKRQSPLAVGDRAPNAEVTHPSSGTAATLFDVFDNERHTLLAVGASHQNVAAAASDYAEELQVVHVIGDAKSPSADHALVVLDAERQVQQRYHMPSGGYALIRPDRYIGALGNAHHTDGLDLYLRRTFTDRPRH